MGGEFGHAVGDFVVPVAEFVKVVLGLGQRPRDAAAQIQCSDLVVDQPVQVVVLVAFRMGRVVGLVFVLLVAFIVVGVAEAGDEAAAGGGVVEAGDPVVGVVVVSRLGAVAVDVGRHAVAEVVGVGGDGPGVEGAVALAIVALLDYDLAAGVVHGALAVGGVVEVTDRVAVLHGLQHAVGGVVAEVDQPAVAQGGGHAPANVVGEAVAGVDGVAARGQIVEVVVDILGGGVLLVDALDQITGKVVGELAGVLLRVPGEAQRVDFLDFPVVCIIDITGRLAVGRGAGAVANGRGAAAVILGGGER